MAATSSSRPLATLIALAALLGVLALIVTPASASQLNFYGGRNCTGQFVAECLDFSCCTVPAGAVSYEFQYVRGSIAYLYQDYRCRSISNANFSSDVNCTNYVSFKSALLLAAVLKVGQQASLDIIQS